MVNLTWILQTDKSDATGWSHLASYSCLFRNRQRSETDSLSQGETCPSCPKAWTESSHTQSISPEWRNSRRSSDRKRKSSPPNVAPFASATRHSKLSPPLSIHELLTVFTFHEGEPKGEPGTAHLLRPPGVPQCALRINTFHIASIRCGNTRSRLR